tara:strand:+ start:62476 stop:63468 length:993 start_codon:yes stop_codon:yes gene_type:complete
MPELEIITFDEALRLTEGAERSLLTGNGFSINYFNYSDLMDAAGIEEGMSIKALFDVLNTVDFETVMKSLQDAVVVATAYDDADQAEKYENEKNAVRQSLVRAIHASHPAHRSDIGFHFNNCIDFLKYFSNRFTLNYDLLLYWAQLDDTGVFNDGFGLDREERRNFVGPFAENAHCNTYNIHGGLHLFKNDDGTVSKRVRGANGMIEAIADMITRGKRLPLYVAEGTSRQKLGKIYSVEYLTHCYERLCESEGPFFIYGHSAHPNDEHIYKAIFKSNVSHLYFCIHQPSANVQEISGELARFKEKYGSNIEYTFVCSESANVWGRIQGEE